MARILLKEKTAPKGIAIAKMYWFTNLKVFKDEITDHFEPFYLGDRRFLKCLAMLRQILYQQDDLDVDAVYPDDNLNQNNHKETKDADPMKEGLFQKCMKEIDGYLMDTKGSDEIVLINDMAKRNG
jgi:hypothetical protein